MSKATYLLARARAYTSEMGEWGSGSGEVQVLGRQLVSFLLSTHIHPALNVTVLNDKSSEGGKTSEMPVHPWACELPAQVG